MSRPDVQVGDVVDVPKGADDVCTTRYRVQAAELDGYGVTGPRVKADGDLMISGSTGKSVTRTVPWEVVAKATVLRQGVPVSQPAPASAPVTISRGRVLSVFVQVPVDLMAATIETLERVGCQFDHCPGPDVPPQDMMTCYVCGVLRRLRGES